MSIRLGKTLANGTAFAVAATACAACGNAILRRRAPALRPAIDGAQAIYDWDGGRVAYTTAGEGEPVLLIHSHNAAASSYEMKQVFQRLQSSFQVFAPDLPGYGRSERRRHEYFAHTYIRFLHDFTRDIVGHSPIVVAASLSGAHALLAAHEDAGVFAKLVLASPTGLSQESIDAPRATRRIAGVSRLPVWGEAAFNALTSKASLRWYYENRVYHNPWAVTHEMVQYAWESAHQPNAMGAPASFLGGGIWVDAREAYVSTELPVLLVWGGNDRLNPFERVRGVLPSRPNVSIRVVPECGGAPYDEKADEFVTIMRAFLAEEGSSTGNEG